MENLNINEAVQKRVTLEKDIFKLINDFEKETALAVESVTLSRLHVGAPDYPHATILQGVSVTSIL